MAVVPDSKIGKVEFFETRIPKWLANAIAMGTSVDAVSDLDALTVDAREAFRAQQAAQQAARTATLQFEIAVNKMATAGASIIKQVRAKAGLSGDTIYSLASIPVPAKPSPKAAPGKPNRLVTTLTQLGGLKLTWSCDNPKRSTGTMYQVWRCLVAPDGTRAGPIYLGGSGTKEFVDANIPPGTARIIYSIQAIRSTKVGELAEFPVNLGGLNGAMARVRIGEMQLKASKTAA